MADEITEEEIREEIPAEEEAVAERPEYIPEKFWKEGQPDIEAMGKSYIQLETHVGSKEEVIKEKLIEDLAKERAEKIPEKYELPKLPEGITSEMVEENPMYVWWGETAKTNSMNQEEYEAGINAYVEMMQGQQPNIEEELKALGENGNVRLDAVNAWASKTFPPEEYEAIQFSLGATAQGIQAIERIMDLQKSGVKSEQYTQPEKKLTIKDARQMMNDKRYFDPRYRDETYVAKVDQLFRMLTK